MTRFGGAKMRAALEHLASERNIGLGGIRASPPRAAPRIADHAAGCPAPFRARARLGPPVLGPFPDIAYHVVQAKAVGGEAADRRRSFPAVEALIGEGEGALPIIRQPRPVRRQ